jgi:SAM-dependent methyltransferase
MYPVHKILLYEFVLFIKKVVKKFINHKKAHFKIKRRYSKTYAKFVTLKSGVAHWPEFFGNGVTWFYTAYDREDKDPLTNYLLKTIDKEYKHGGDVLVTGCGTGIMAFHIGDNTKIKVEAFDLLPKVINCANILKNKYFYNNVTFKTNDGFNPKELNTYDAITLVHWVFSAWSGNYGNVVSNDAFTKSVREEKLFSLLNVYTKHLNEGGKIFIEVTDAITDYRNAEDHHLGEISKTFYPIRHSKENMQYVCDKVGLKIVDMQLCVSYGHHPRTLYVLENE